MPIPFLSNPSGLTKSDVGLGSVDNTPDSAKPVSTATQTALDAKPALGSASPAANTPGGTVGSSVAAAHDDHAHPTTGLIRTATVTTKGDLLTATGSGAVTRRGVGANDTVLVADSAQSDGVKWAAVPGIDLKANLASPAHTGTMTIDTDVNLYRTAADVLKTDDAFRANGVIRSERSGAPTQYVQINGGDVSFGYLTFESTSTKQLHINNNGNAGATPGQIRFQTGGTTQVAVESTGDKLLFGTAQDTNLYRSAADTLKTDDSLSIATNLTVAGGTRLGSVSSTASGSGAVAEGYSTASGGQSHSEGYSTTASGSQSHSEGNGSIASSNYSHAQGYAAVANRSGQHSHANGQFAAAGDAQTSTMVLGRSTTDATPSTLWTLALGTVQLAADDSSVFTLLASHGYRFRIEAVARSTAAGAGEMAGWTITGTVARGSTGSARILGTPTTTTDSDAGASTWTLGVSVDTTNSTYNYLKITATGEASKTIRWVATITATEVG